LRAEAKFDEPHMDDEPVVGGIPMIKPGRYDRKLEILISGAELVELQRFVWMMAESYGLDRRIERYRGRRPIGLYRWDMDSLLNVLHSALADPWEYSSEEEPDHLILQGLRERLQQAYDEAYPE
jgi:hypothetical protein